MEPLTNPSYWMFLGFGKIEEKFTLSKFDKNSNSLFVSRYLNSTFWFFDLIVKEVNCLKSLPLINKFLFFENDFSKTHWFLL